MRRKIVLLTIVGILLAAGVYAACMNAAGGEDDEECGKVTIYNDDGSSESYESNLGIIAIDPGHGGTDPGKVSAKGNLEKNVNLEIALKLKKLLEDEGYKVIMTREEDSDTCTGDYSKVEDLENRVDIIRDSGAEIVVSIHQNSFPDSTVKGAQVFYSGDESEAENLARSIQESLLEADGENRRQVRKNDDYYLFVHTEIPIVIVECGFMSNPEEEEKLMTDAYRDLLAGCVFEGITKYLNSSEN